MRLFRLPLIGFIFALFSASTVAGEACRVAYDLGSSGIRAGASNSGVTARAEIDYLAPLWAGRGLDETLAPTLTALRDLREKAGFAADCVRVGGGFSAWRLALAQDAGRLAAMLARIRQESGVAVLVIPQRQEGAYGFIGARRLLGERLTTSHVLDIGGGSLQVAGAETGFGETLGQKVWHRQLCRELRGTDAAPCELQPLSGDELATARRLIDEKLSGIAAALPVGAMTLTAISRPVSRGVAPAVLRLTAGEAGGGVLRQADLAGAIAHLAVLDREATAARVGARPDFAAYLLSDMLLVDGVLRATGVDALQVAEIDLTNLPGLLADDRAYAWEQHFACYLDRLREQGLAAYASDPETCR